MSEYIETVQYLERLQIMPKTMPGLEKIKRALVQTDWYAGIDPKKMIVVAGTNGKGSTCAILESLFLSAKKKVGFYSSPHLVSTTERIRTNGKSITEKDFVKIFSECKTLIDSCELSHFEALTLMGGHYFFSRYWAQDLDYILLEVGLGGTYDATNAFPHAYSVMTALGLDHTSILGRTLSEVAMNKFGIVQENNIVVHHKISSELLALKNTVQQRTSSEWIEAKSGQVSVRKNNRIPEYILNSPWGEAEINLPGERAAQNAMTALTLFEKLGFDPRLHLNALATIQWNGRMQKMSWPGLVCPLYLSGDHNSQGIKSLISILKDFEWTTLHLIVGIGVDKDAHEMLTELCALKNIKLYLTVTPFKGLSLSDYPQEFIDQATKANENPIELLKTIQTTAQPQDLVLATGSLYLVGEFLTTHR